MTNIVTEYVYTFSKDNQPSLKVEPGEIVTLETLDCFSNQIEAEGDELSSIDFTKVNPATGPVYLKGAEPGDLLVVDILDIQVENRGVGVNGPGMGPLQNVVSNEVKLIDVKEGKVSFNDLEFETNLMIGVIGVAPKEGSIPCGQPGDHGGNLDNKLITTGARLYFPVNVEGALFQCGDLHAAMGDGEISGAGLEIPGRVKVKLDVIKGAAGNRPVLETEDKWYTIAASDDFTKAMNLVTSDMQKLLVEAYGWTETEAAIYMSLQGDAEICQACVPSELDLVLRFGVPKRADKPLISK